MLLALTWNYRSVGRWSWGPERTKSCLRRADTAELAAWDMSEKDYSQPYLPGYQSSDPMLGTRLVKLVADTLNLTRQVYISGASKNGLPTETKVQRLRRRGGMD